MGFIRVRPGLIVVGIVICICKIECVGYCQCSTSKFVMYGSSAGVTRM